jgi:NitT/TauT family transport system permease protein
MASRTAAVHLLRPGPRTRWNSGAALWTGRILVPVLVVLAWVFAAQQTTLVPGVAATWAELTGGFSDGWMVEPLNETMKAVLGGFALALVTGAAAGYAIGRIRFLAQVFDPIVAGMFAVPRVILYPIFLTLFGVGTTSKLAMAAVSAFFPIVLSTAAAMRAVDPTLVRLGRSLGCTHWWMATRIYFPATAPTVLVGFRVGFSVAFISVIIAEFVATDIGLGLLAARAYGQLELPRMFAVVAVITVIAILCNLLMWSLERRIRRD